MLAVTSVAQSAVTHPAWSEIQGTLMEQMHAFVSPYKANPSALQILLALCGDAFAQAYFPAERAHRYLLVEPFMSQDTRRELEQQLLSDLLTFLAPHMVNVIQSNAMQRLKEGMTESYARHAAAQPCTTNVDLAAQIAILHLHGHFCTLPLSTPVLPPTASFLTVVAKMPTVSPLDADKTLRSQALADEVNLFRMCHGRSLPMQLRQLLWFRRLYVPDKCTDLRWRLQANQAIMSLTQPWSSSIASLLFRLVRDSLADMPTAAVYAPDQSRLCDTLNLWYVMTKLQSSHFLHLAMPLVHLFPSFDSKDIEIVSCLHVFLNTYHRCAISRSELNAATQRIWLEVGRRHSTLFQVIDEIYTNSKLDCAEKPSHLFDSWVQSALVSFLPHHGVDFVWDQCMLSSEGWRTSLEHFCVDVCGLLAPQLHHATAVAGLKAIIEHGPRRIVTQDLRNAHRLRSPSS
ncbi:hypothetical protein H310_04050 [Aphanomyces invadans]|uniref:Uncharacterized protein n=1 Tax=Aphanomyces invadans TaxID=157072 RepID=A0A024UFD2_9STRA|nr:hypothetical protein H310_04050 [Aphanomyces invadans]ETW04974.1 hypothetical protein H310_04050 [Aphanomyces invadans]|eukprot:XP_008866413.1 hypothetical protein H310_04050 [Aphanomyces invadans]